MVRYLRFLTLHEAIFISVSRYLISTWLLIEFTVVRKRRYAERLENEMHYLRKAKSKSEEHSRELTTKLKRQQVRLTAIRQQAFINILRYPSILIDK